MSRGQPPHERHQDFEAVEVEAADLALTIACSKLKISEPGEGWEVFKDRRLFGYRVAIKGSPVVMVYDEEIYRLSQGQPA